MTVESEFESDIQIDEHALDEEWVGQPKVYFQYAAELASARRDLDRAKSHLELTKCELYRSISSQPDRYDLSKTTEAAIGAAIPVQPEYVARQLELSEARHRVDVLQAAVTALDHRRKALENLVSLFLASYFSSPRARAGSEDEVDDMKKRSVRRKSKRGRG